MSEPLPLTGRNIALPESRELDLLARMLEREGASVLRRPLVSILDAEDQQHVVAWIDELIAGRFDDILFYTGEGLRRLLACAERAGKRAEMVAALASVRKICRGPKPAKALREIELTPDVRVEPATTDGIVATLGAMDFSGRRLGVQLFDQNPPKALDDFLRERGVDFACVSPYRYAPASDASRVEELIDSLESGNVDAIAFTSASQVDRLWQVAAGAGKTQALENGLKKTLVAAVGPVVEQRLADFGVAGAVTPEEKFFMKPLVDAIVHALTQE